MFRLALDRCPRDGAALEALYGDPLEGTTLAERYVIERCIGEGAMGRVYAARHARMTRRFAIKILWGELAADDTTRARFAREAEAASRLDHPNLISVVDFGETAAGLLYLAMDYAQGRCLADVIDEEGPFPPARVEHLVRQLCQGLVHAHGKGLIHRDFKSDNIMVDGSGPNETARIVDFGIAMLADGGDESGRLTTQGLVLGTPAYMAPEQAAGQSLDHRTDLYALGIVTYELLAGCLPFVGSALEVARMNLAATPPPIRERVPGLEVDARLEAICMRLLAKNPADRYQDASEVLAALDRKAEPAPAEADPAPPAARPRLLGWRRAAALAGAVLLIGGSAAVFVLRDGGGATRAGGTGAAAETAPPSAPPDPRIETSPPAAAAPEAIAPDDVVVAAREDEPATEPDTLGAPAEPREPPTPQSRTSPPRRSSAGSGDRRGASRPPAGAHDDEVRTEPANAPKQQPPPADPAPAAAAPISSANLTAAYRRVGEALERLARDRGDDAAAPLRKRYFALPYPDALRDPALRTDVIRQLESLRRDIERQRSP